MDITHIIPCIIYFSVFPDRDEWPLPFYQPKLFLSVSQPNRRLNTSQSQQNIVSSPRCRPIQIASACNIRTPLTPLENRTRKSTASLIPHPQPTASKQRSQKKEKIFPKFTNPICRNNLFRLPCCKSFIDILHFRQPDGWESGMKGESYTWWSRKTQIRSNCWR